MKIKEHKNRALSIAEKNTWKVWRPKEGEDNIYRSNRKFSTSHNNPYNANFDMRFDDATGF